MSMKDWKPNSVKKKHVLAAAKIWDTSKYRNFKNSISYDVIIRGNPYPPKAIVSCAHELATGHALRTNEFSGMKDGLWHDRLKALGFSIVEKRLQIDFDTEVAAALKMSAKKRAELLAKMPRIPPEKVTTQIYRYVRSSLVVAERLALAKGRCENCKKPAPFMRKKDGKPFLEVHHIKPLSKGGLDVIENTKAVCPNCHCEIHDKMDLDINNE